jgi:carbonic anhydrase
MRLTLVGLLVLGMAGGAAGQATAQAPGQAGGPAGAPWDYEGKRGPFEWHKLDPAYRACAGKEQSPVDIRGAHLNKSLPPIEFHYIAGPVTLVNTGHTIQVRPDKGSYIVYDGVRYDLVQYHFHHPSEEAVKGRLTDMVIHLVHQSVDGKQAVIALRLNVDPGNPNAVLAALWPHLPTKTGDTARVTDEINAAGLLPADRGYWTYVGSLTAPPCTEGVRWLIFEEELTLSREQLRAFTAIYKMNSRPLQDLHGRRIEANE